MATTLEYALMAGGSYISSRPDDKNKFPVPKDWTMLEEATHWNLPSGFEAVSFRSGNEIVISYAGTDPEDIKDIITDRNLFRGFGDIQLNQAAAYYLFIKNNPLYSDCTITLTGHSLGGGLASLMAV